MTFEPTKDHFHIISKYAPHGEYFPMLGVTFDTKLTMDVEVHALMNECGWRVSQILRGGRFFGGQELIFLFKQHVLSKLEYRTAALYHASDTVLEPLDSLQRRVLRAACVSELDALHHHRLAPLGTRRDIAVLGLIHRQVLGKGPKQLGKFFALDEEARGRRTTRLQANRHRLQLQSHCGGQHTDYLRRSIFGAIDVYNLLPPYIVEEESDVSKFQARLQDLVLSRALAGCSDWALSLSPRVPLHAHPLRCILL